MEYLLLLSSTYLVFNVTLILSELLVIIFGGQARMQGIASCRTQDG